MCEMVCQTVQKKQEEKRIEEEQAANAQYWKIPACCDDDDDYNSAITPNEPVDSLSMGDEHLNTIPATKSDEFIKSCVENLLPNPSESEGENGCDVLACFTTFSNILFDAEYEFDPSDDQSLSDEDFSANFFSKRLLYDNSSSRPPKEFVSENSNADIKSFSPSPIPVEDSDSRMEEIDLSFNPDDPMPPGIKEDDDDSERDILILEELPSNHSISLSINESFYFDIPSFSRRPAKPPDGDTGILNIKMMGDNSEQKVPIHGLTITRVLNQEKYPDLLSHRSLENFQLSAKYPMMIHGKNIPILDVPLFHFYPLYQLKYGGNWVKLSDLKQTLRGRHPMLIIVHYSRKLEDSCQRILSSKSSFSQLQLGINLLHLAGSQPMLKSSYKADDDFIISIPPLVGGMTDVVVEIKGT
nr:hypothetical protein [Tanacetum cinerariifolium]